MVTELRYQLMKWEMATADIVPFEPDARFTENMLLHKARGVLGEGHDEEILRVIRRGAGIGELMGWCYARLRETK